MIDRGEWADRSRGDVLDFLDCVDDIVEDKLARIRLGVYSEEQDGTLQEILEEIERILR